MAYATATDMIDRFGATELAQLADRRTPPVVSEEMLKTAAAGGDLSGYTAAEREAIDGALAVIDQKLADADASIDGYLVGRYTLPLTRPATVLTRIACDVARYLLYDDRPTEHVTKRHDDAVAFLKGISEGKIQLGLDTDQQPATVAGRPEYTAPERVFTRDTLKDF